MKELIETEPITGRGGLNVPGDYHFDRKNNGEFYAIDGFVLSFFQKLWQINNVDIYERSTNYNASQFHELVVPPETESPLVVIRYNYTPTSADHRSFEKHSNMMDPYLGYSGRTAEDVTLGYEKHSVLLPPHDDSLQWKPLLTASRNLGGYEHSSIETENEIDFSKPKAQDIYTNAINKALSQFVELVSVPVDEH